MDQDPLERSQLDLSKQNPGADGIRRRGLTHLVEADFSVSDFEDCIAKLLVLLDGLVHVLTLVGQLDAGHCHLEVVGGVESWLGGKSKGIAIAIECLTDWQSRLGPGSGVRKRETEKKGRGLQSCHMA